MRIGTRLRLPATIVLATTLIIAAPLALSGCSLIGGVVNGATGGGGGVPGIGAGSVPKDFPKDVPLIDGDVQLGVGLGDSKDGKVWNVTIKTTDTDAAKTIATQMDGAGFESQGDQSTSDGSGAAYIKDKLTVVVVVGTSDKDIIANYTVTETK